MNKSPYLVDVPVKVNIWIRPECQKKQFEILRQAKPSILFIQSDGGRNEKEWIAIRENRKIFDNEIDWDCDVHKLYEDINQGLYTMSKKTGEYIWNRVDRCIFLEDDQIPSVSFFQYCAELLEKYKDDLRIDCICGFNTLGIYEECSADYFFSRQGSIWGTATWKNRIEMRDKSFSYAKDRYVMKLINQRARHNPMFVRRAVAYGKQKYFEGHVAGSEFYHEFAMYGYNQLQIVPKCNLISNVGVGSDSEHADELHQLPHGIRRVFNSPNYEINFPLQHPAYVIPDVFYEKKRNRVMGYNTPIVGLYRKMERIFLKLKSGDISYIIRKIKKRTEE